MVKRPAILGIHHITAIAGDPQANLDFYARVLGLRLVKRTVNFDDPSTYHLYYGDERGTPGTILTFFPWPGARRGRVGTGQVTVTALSIPATALGYWMERLAGAGVEVDEPEERFDETALSFLDPDGLQLELVAHPGALEIEPWKDGPVPAEHAVRGFHGATLCLEGYERTAGLLSETLGFRLSEHVGNRYRYRARSSDPGTRIDLVCAPGSAPGAIGVGTVHHIAWRAPDEETQVAWRRTVAERGLNVTPVLDRQYFRSIYFREPGGVLFEIATDSPGFTLDEPIDALGSALKLPPWLEGMRNRIEAALPALEVP